MRRNLLLLAALGGVAIAGAGGWFAGTRIQSSGEAAASAKPPAAGPVTAKVERRTLASSVVTRGTAKYSEPSAVALADGGNGRVTRPPEAGTQLGEGSVAMEVNGAPVFALQGSRPNYREMKPGVVGEDVLQLEQALARLGFSPGAVDGTYDDATALAVDRWYAAAGYTPHGATDAEKSELRSARNGVDQAETALRNAERQLADATKAPSETDLRSAENDIARANDGLTAARNTAAANDTKASRDVTTIADALTAAREKALTDADKAARLIETRRVELVVARANLESARIRRDTARGESYSSALASHVQAQQAVEQAERAVDEAVTARDRQPTDSAKAVADAQRALDDARNAVPRVHGEGEAAVRQAEGALELAKLRLDALRNPKSSDALNAAVADARTSLARARADLAEVGARVGTRVPASNIVFFSSLPLRIDSVKLKRGDAASGEVMTVSGAELLITSSVTVADARLLKPGMTATVEAPDLKITLQATITAVAGKPGTEGLDNQHVFVALAPIDPPATFKDAAVKVTIPVKSTAGDVLVVPVAAISSAADGSARVDVVAPDEMRTVVAVNTGLSAGGFVEVSAKEGQLREGDRVVVGVQ